MPASPRIDPPPPIGPAADADPPPRWAVRALDRLGRRWWLVTAALLPVVCGLIGCGLSVAGMRELVALGFPAGELLTAEVPRAVALCLWPGLAACGAVILTAPAPSARPLAVLCAAATSFVTLDSGANDLAMAQRGRGTGARRAVEVWVAPAALGGLAFILWLEHGHGARTVRRREENEEQTAFPRLWRGGE